MAYTVTPTYKDVPFAGQGATAVCRVNFTAEAYTNGTGVDVDLKTAGFKFDSRLIRYIVGVGLAGHNAHVTPSPTAAAPWKVTMRVFAGTTENVTGNITMGFDLVLCIGPDRL